VDTITHHLRREILSSDNEPFSGGAYWDILLFNVASINPHRRPSDEHRVLAQAVSKKDDWRRLEKPGAPGSLTTETLVALMMDAALLYVDVDGVGGHDKVMVLGGAGHGDLVRSLAQTLNLSGEALLILLVHIGMDMCRLRSLG
jgi:hypothetical protein